ncbi:MAG: DUF5009 domain-containing protein [Myxococcaceae bacterium]
MRERDVSLDVFRGLAIALMVPVNYLEHVLAAPAWVKHAPDIGLTVADFVAPFFIFAIGLTYPASLRRRWSTEGKQKTVEHVLRRSLALLGLGALFTLGETSYGFGHAGVPWGTLQAIGAASLLAAPLVFVPAGPRLVLGLALLVGYQLGLDAWWLEQVLASSHAGLPGALSWTALLVLSTVVADWLPASPGRVVVLGFGSLALGIGAAFVTPLSKHRMSLPFVLVVFGAAILTFFAVRALLAKGVTAKGLVAWGKNPLVLYVAHLVLLGAFLVPEARWWHVEASLPQAAVQFVVYAGVLHALARGLERKGVFISF